ncbi:unnamed protein product [Toxocara canis]|uniref:Cytoplasmic tRNA 2-thiolation protein 2 n=1 Tax=Toxocara canis TaxID=6265 RepID=A0A183TWP0_TOXCA|nr:unnamed protein product [Toxocara canis]
MCESVGLRKCVKCPEPGTLAGLDPSKASYCKPCFIQMVKHKFSSTIGKRRLYKDGEKRETLIVFEGDGPSAFLLSLISQGLRADAHKRLTLIPTVIYWYDYANHMESISVMVLLTVTDEEAIAFVKRRVENFKDVVDARWIFVHISSIFGNFDDLDELNSIGNVESIAKWERVLNACLTESVRSEFVRLSRALICVRVARRLGVNKVMMSDSADNLAKCVIYSLAFARGSSISCLSGAVDKTYPHVSIIRPLREISNKEIALLNRFENSDRFIIHVDGSENCKHGLSVQSATSEFVDNLQVEGFRATITTILSTATKLQSISRKKTRCQFCSALFQSELDDERFVSEFVCFFLLFVHSPPTNVSIRSAFSLNWQFSFDYSCEH